MRTILAGLVTAGLLAIPFTVDATSITADATLVVGHCQGGASSKITCDTATGREWLDLTESFGYSLNEVLAGAGGFIADEWSVANGTQVDELFLHAGLSHSGLGVGYLSTDSSDGMAVDLLLSTLGITGFDYRGSPIGIGLSIYGEDLSVPGSVSLPYFYRWSEQAVVTSGSVYRGTNLELTGDSKSDWGVFLTRAVAVPEPDTLSLFAIAILGAGIFGRWSSRRLQ